MAKFNGIEASVEAGAIRLHFSLDKPAVVGWQVLDPDTGAFLFEGEWNETRDLTMDLQVTLPAENGHYRVQVAPVKDRSRFILLDAQMEADGLRIDAPRVCSARALQWSRIGRAIPKAFAYPAQSLWTNHKLIASMVRRDITARYRGSFGGALWTFLNPLLMMGIYFFVFGILLKSRFESDPSNWGFVLYLFAGMLPWLAFAEAVGRSPYVILEHRNFVRKLVFPLETLPLNLVISGVVTETFGLLIFAATLLIARHAVPPSVLWLPLVLIPQLLLTAGLCWFLAALGVFLRDLGQIVGFVLMGWMYLTPIFYSESHIPAVAQKILRVNPFAAIVRAYRAVLLENRAPDWGSLAALCVGSAALAILGHAWFHRLRRTFADVI